METVKFYSWLCISVYLLVCSVRAIVQTGEQCDPHADKPTANPNDYCSFYFCKEQSPTTGSWVKINCSEAEYFGALNNQCEQANGIPCPVDTKSNPQPQPETSADSLAFDPAPDRPPAQAPPSLSLSFGERRAALPGPY